jgi:hypothetical protein
MREGRLIDMIDFLVSWTLSLVHFLLRSFVHSPMKVDTTLRIDDIHRTHTIIKTITFESSIEDELGEGPSSTSQSNSTPQFKQLEPLKMVKRDLSKDFLTSSPSTSSADTVIHSQKFIDKRLGS